VPVGRVIDSSVGDARAASGSGLPVLPEPTVFHAIGWYGTSPGFADRFELFLESVDRAERVGVRRLAFAASPGGWSREGWEILSLERDARSVGDVRAKPFLKDLLDGALERAAAGDWLLYTNADLGLAPDTYARLRAVRGSAVEYMRQDVDGDPRTLEELFAGAAEPYRIGLDGFAIRASLYADLRDAVPDFVIGEPHWDTALSEILRRIVPVRRDATSFYHPRHAQVWDIAHPTPAGRHNEALFVAALLQGSVPRHQIVDGPDRTDSAVIVTSFGSDPDRARANVEGLTRQLRQDLYADVYLVELLLDDEESRFPAELLAEVRHLVLRGDDSCGDLFQKEALQNVGWRVGLAEGGYDYFLFTDADVFATELDWLSRMRARLRDDPTRAVQGFRLVTDPLDDGFGRSSVGATFVLGHQTDMHANPGIAWGLHRSLLEQGDGFNPLCIDCGGDSAFVAEYVNGPDATYDPWLLDFRWFAEIQRDVPVRAALDCVEVDLVHVNHGPSRDRNYQEVRYAIDGFPPIHELVELGSDGLLRWRDPGCVERRLLRLRAEMRSRADVDRLFDRHGYARRSVATVRLPAVRDRPRPATPPPPIGLRTVAAPPADAPGRLPIFDPREVFRDVWPFSWADNVERPPGTTYAPLRGDREQPVLHLRRVSESRPVVVAIAARPTWSTVDVAGFTSLELTVLVEGDGDPEVLVWLTSHATDGTDSDSERVALGRRGLVEGRRQRFSIALDELAGASGFDPGRMRQVVVHAQGCDLLELSQVAVTGDGDDGAARTPDAGLVRSLPARGFGEGRVRIERGTVLSARGEPLRGVPVWIYKFGSRRGLSDHVRDRAYYEQLAALGINSVRLVCFDAWQRSHGFPHYAYERRWLDRVLFLRELDTAVSLASRAGLQVLVNYHDVGRLDLEHCLAFWNLVAGRYADRRNVFYELANEPVAWLPDDWDDEDVEAQRTLFAAVRELAPETHIVVCSFPNPAGGNRSMADVAGELAIDWSNASLGFHCYGTGGTSDAIVAARGRFPVLCTEVDVPISRGGDPHVTPMDGDEWSTATLERLGIGWFAWRCNGPDELRRNFVDGFAADARRRGDDWTGGG
jgi:hypothetical protein